MNYSPAALAFRDILKQVPIGIIILDGPEFFVKYANDHAHKILDKEEKAFIGLPLLKAIPELDSSILIKLKEILEKGSSCDGDQFEIKRGNFETPEISFVSLTFKPLCDDEGKINGVIATVNELNVQVEASQNLELSQNHFFNLVIQSPLAMAIFKGPEMRVEIANDAMLKLWGKESLEVRGMKHLDILPEFNDQKFPGLMQEVFTTGKAITENECLVILNSRERYVNYLYAPMYGYDGKSITGIIVTVTDITENVEARIKIKESENKYRQLIEGLPMALYTCNMDGKMEIYNKAAVQLWGKEPDSGLMWGGALLLFDMDGNRLSTEELPMYQAIKRQEKVSRELIFERPNGEMRYVKPYVQPLFDAEGKLSGAVNMIIDFTENKKTENALRESEQRLNIAIEAAELGIYHYNLITGEVIGSKRYMKIFDYDPLENIDREEILKRIHPEDRGILKSAHENSRKTGILDYEVRLYRRDGKLQWIKIRGKLLFNSLNVAEKLLGTAMDITEQKMAHLALKESEERQRIAIESANLGTWDLSPKTGEFLMSHRTKKMFGIQETTQIDVDTALSAIKISDREKVNSAMDNAISSAGKYDIEYTVIGIEDKIDRVLRAVGKVIYDENNEPHRFLGILMDMTESRKAEMILRESEERFRQVADTAPALIWMSGTNGECTYFNTAWLEFTGRTIEQEQGFGWTEGIHTDDYDRYMNLYRETLSARKAFYLEYRLKRADGKYRWLSHSARPRFTENEFVGFIGACMDIHERRTMSEELETRVTLRTQELKKANEELEKMNQELSSFAYISGHDLQEPLRKIQTFISRLMEMERENLSDRGKDYFKRIHNSSIRMQTLINDLLSYSRTSNQNRKLEESDLNLIIEDIKNELRETLEEKSAVIEYHNLPTLTVVKFQFRQLFMNLISNALKFSKWNVNPHIKITSELVQGDQKKIGLKFPDKKHYHISVIDNGIGFDPKYKSRIFEVFQRLHGKDQYTGTGIGLAICKKIVENHSGSISAEGDEDNGSTFHIYLPVE